jgi:quercetin dioxygenase-like cupin family protein
VTERSFNALGCDFARYEFAPGEGLPRHNHAGDHLMIVLAGRVRVTTDEVQREFGPADRPVLFRAPKFHAIEALEASSILNVFARAAAP